MKLQNRFSLAILIGVILIICIALLFMKFRAKPTPPIPSTQLKYEKYVELENLARSGDPIAQYELTLFLDDPKEIRSLLKKASESGYPPAMVTYAVSIMSDNAESSIQARMILESAAKDGHYPAIVELTLCVSKGKCGPSSARTALTWAVVSRLLFDRKLIEQNKLESDEENFREQLSKEEAITAETTAKELASRIQKVTN